MGSHLTERLLAEGVEVIGIDNLFYGSLITSRARSRIRTSSSSRSTARGDWHFARRLHGCDAIVHLAALKIPRYGNALATLDENVAGMSAVADVACRSDADLVVASTSDVYGNADAPFNEDGELVLVRRRRVAGRTPSRSCSTSTSASHSPRSAGSE